jgi:hypothetical protein
MIDDIVKRLRSQHNDLQQNVYYSPAEEPAWDATANAADKIEQLYKMLATERTLVDQLAETLDRVGEHRCPLTCPTCISLNAWKKERHE